MSEATTILNIEYAIKKLNLHFPGSDNIPEKDFLSILKYCHVLVSTFFEYVNCEIDDSVKKYPVSASTIVSYLNDALNEVFNTSDYVKGDEFIVEDGQFYLKSEEPLYTVKGWKDPDKIISILAEKS